MRIFPVADPYVLRVGNRFYLYAAGRENGNLPRFTKRMHLCYI